ncbi:aconitate hydratase AcnA [Lactobacillus sp. CC-MHH1034]|uniref:aconitate hydratase AcnA n=1 Tax=Agrilactobacillus fermenti TaxID=2586909 RepID=UPI001E45CC27|nr:aconitate hydratase AcnA [Agrilactobacillus fermenti]MCD2256569.1 aconitate hydratase AcnA [Agrilactobacillus fermenti]
MKSYKDTFPWHDQVMTYWNIEQFASDHGKLPYTIRILLEMVLRHDANNQQAALNLLNWDQNHKADVPFKAQRVLLQDFTGVPALVDIAAMRDKVQALKGNGAVIDPEVPVHLIIDHSVQVNFSGSTAAFSKNQRREFQINQERYQFLKWAQQAFDNLTIIPPDNGIIHQVNLEHIAQVIMTQTNHSETLVYPDTVVGTDSHTTMTNGLGVLGWGVGGIEAEASMLGEITYYPIPEVIGVYLKGQLPAGSTATDLALTVTQRLRQENVVGKFIEFFGDGLRHLPVADRATIANMAPEYGATCGYFPIDQQTIDYLTLTGREQAQIDLVAAYAQQNHLWDTGDLTQQYSQVLTIDLSQIGASLAGPKRPQDLVPLKQLKQQFKTEPHDTLTVETKQGKQRLKYGAIGIAAITSCTNTSNPALMITTGLLARNAVKAGLTVPDYVKTSLAPGSRAVTDYLAKAGLTPYLDQLGFQLVGYGCTTCIGNSGDLKPELIQALQTSTFPMAGILSGNRNFEGRVNPLIKDTYLASPPLVIAFALAGTLAIDLTQEPIGTNQQQQPIYLRDIWPTPTEISLLVKQVMKPAIFQKNYAHILQGNQLWQQLKIAPTKTFPWQKDSTYIAAPPFFDHLNSDTATQGTSDMLTNLRALAKLGDSITTDHISPAGFIGQQTAAGRYLLAKGVQPSEFNSYGSRRGNHEVMIRGTLANIRIKNQLVPGKEGGYTKYWPTGEVLDIYDAAQRYQQLSPQQCNGLVILAGKDYGMGSSRDWAAKGVKLLGVKAVIAKSFERIHRSNLVMMGVLPLEFMPDEDATTLGLTGRESFQITLDNAHHLAHVIATDTFESQSSKAFNTRIRFDTPSDATYYENDGILPMIIRQTCHL